MRLKNHLISINCSQLQFQSSKKKSKSIDIDQNWSKLIDDDRRLWYLQLKKIKKIIKLKN